MSDPAPRSDEAIPATERWFLRRGLPHFIADYSPTRDVLTRAVPLLTLIFLFEVANAPAREFPIWLDVIAVATGFAILLGAWMLANRIRGRPLLARPVDVGVFEVAVFVFVPPALPLVFGGQWRSALATALGIALLLAVIYPGTSFGVVPCVVRLMERSAHTGRSGSSAGMPPMRMPRDGGGVDYGELHNPLADSEWERRRWRYERRCCARHRHVQLRARRVRALRYGLAPRLAARRLPDLRRSQRVLARLRRVRRTISVSGGHGHGLAHAIRIERRRGDPREHPNRTTLRGAIVQRARSPVC